ncbi:MAG: hypothetical protein KME21_05675 [Desmonostoc vinosum HA7617-LM4]|jgi:hypothetical protein|nr:hypothetical protein [Desmonostoc vinosum HA7617-LM4]
MEHWQFLIQKQGDRSWQTLESPNVELLEGQYRVLARSNLPNIEVEVRVIYSSTQEVPPKRRIFKRSRRTNSEGLMAVIPFTYFHPGIWELRCSGDLMSEMFGMSWQYSIHLQVLSEELQAGIGGDEGDEGVEVTIALEKTITVSADVVTTDSDLATTVLATAIKQEDAVIDQPVSPVWFKGETAEQILQNLVELALPTSDPLVANETVADFPAIQPPLLLQINLERETYIASWGQTLNINGQVELKEKLNLDLAETLSVNRLCKLELVIELYSPLESVILTQVRQPLLNKALPLSVNTSVIIPAECESKLILADINLYGALDEFCEVSLLASQSFTITADVMALLAITVAKSSQPESSNDDNVLTPAVPTSQTPVSLGLELFNLVKTPKIDQSLAFIPAPNQPLPPQINARLRETSLEEPGERSPQLPKLPVNKINAIAPSTEIADPLIQEESVQKDNIMAAINLEQLVIRHRRNPTFPYLRRLKTSPANNRTKASSKTSDVAELPTHEQSPQPDLILSELENTPELVSENTQLQQESISELVTQPNTELTDETAIEEVAQQNSESIVELENQPSEEPTATDHLQSSRLIRKWMQSQGYSLPESIYIQYQDNGDILDQLTILEQQPLPSLSAQTPLNLDSEIELTLEAEAPEPEEHQQIPLPSALSTQAAWLAQEIVIDDTDAEPQTYVAIATHQLSEQEDHPFLNLSCSLPGNTVITEPLPVPQLRVPDGELIAGKTILVRVELPEVSPQVVVKLWVEDYQTRWLLDGPHLLTHLLPKPLGGWEVMTQLNIPFGCLEIRLEAIALDMATQQESHKVTVVRTVIPPDLPNLQLDELML